MVEKKPFIMTSKQNLPEYPPSKGLTGNKMAVICCTVNLGLTLKSPTVNEENWTLASQLVY